MTAAQSWRSARDCQALDRLWDAVLTSRVIHIEGRWAYPAWPEQLDDDGIVNLATGAGLDLLLSYLDHEMYFGLPALCYALLRSYVRRPGRSLSRRSWISQKAGRCCRASGPTRTIPSCAA
jgi:hypothetical protein